MEEKNGFLSENDGKQWLVKLRGQKVYRSVFISVLYMYFNGFDLSLKLYFFGTRFDNCYIKLCFELTCRMDCHVPLFKDRTIAWWYVSH